MKEDSRNDDSSEMDKPLAIDLYCGLGGWAEGFLAENFDVIGFDIERHDYGTGGYPGWLVLQDIRTLHGSQFKNAAVIVASPPCQKYSYMAMPWYREDPTRQAELNELFNACFRIQREACEAAGRHIPLIVENVKGAQPWLGRAQANFGSFYLWGDIGQVGNRIVAGPLEMGSYVAARSRAQKVPGFRFDGSGGSFQTASVKITGQDWSRFAKTGEVSPHWRLQSTKNDGGSWFNVAHNKESGVGKNPDGRLEACKDDSAGVKQVNGGTQGWFGKYKPTGQGSRNFSSNSVKRKAASAQIAKIPFPLANHIAKCFYPRVLSSSA